MSMVDLDPCVMQPEELDNAINSKLLAKGIHANEQEPEWGEVEVVPSARQLRDQMNSIRNSFQKLCTTREVADLPFVSRGSFFGRLIVFYKRIVRKLIKGALYPYIVQVMNFHSATISVMEEMIKLQEQLVVLEEVRDK